MAFRAGTYTFLCDPHPTSMRGTFTVGAASTSTMALTATVRPASIGLTSVGKSVTKLAACSYRITVRDLTAKGSLHLVGPGVSRKTGVAATGTKTWTVTLRAGTYTLRSDSGAKLTRTIVVS